MVKQTRLVCDVGSALTLATLDDFYAAAIAAGAPTNAMVEVIQDDRDLPGFVTALAVTLDTEVVR